ALNLGPVVDPIGIAIVPGGSASLARVVTISNPGTVPLTFTSTAVFPDEQRWFTSQPAGGSVSSGGQSTVSVQPTPEGLAAGVHQGQLVFTFSDGSRRLVTLVLIIPRISGADRAFSGGQLRPAADIVCAPSQLIPVFVVLSTGSGFNVTVGSPVPIEVV